MCSPIISPIIFIHTQTHSTHSSDTHIAQQRGTFIRALRAFRHAHTCIITNTLQTHTNLNIEAHVQMRTDHFDIYTHKITQLFGHSRY